MTDSGFAVQASYKFGPGNGDMLNVRGDSVSEFAQTLEALKGGINKIQEIGALIRDAGPVTTEQAMANIQQAFPSAQVIQETPPPPPPPVDPWANGGATPQPSAAVQAAPTASAGQCPACSRATACPDCGGPTALGVKTSKNRGSSYNAHQCLANEKHKVVWCKTPIPMSMQPVMGNPGLVYG